MNKRNAIGPGMIWLQLLLIMGIAMVIGQNPTWAGCPPVDAIVDTDGDGFTDFQECNGFQLYDGTPVYNKQNCPAGGICLDPDKKDLFVIWTPAPQSYLTAIDPLVYLRTMPINIHQITAGQSNTDRTIIGTQKAARITEDVTAYDPTQTNVVLGFSWEGTPNTRDDATVYTGRIKGFLETTCGCQPLTSCASGKCCDTTGVCNMDLFYKYVQHTIAHEIGHLLKPLAPVSQRDYQNFGGYHYKPGTGAIMDQSVSYTIKSGKATFNIGTTFTQADKDNITLK